MKNLLDIVNIKLYSVVGLVRAPVVLNMQIRKGLLAEN